MPTKSCPLPRMSRTDVQSSDAVFDYHAALARVDGDKLFLRELAELFVQEWSDRLEAIEAALAARELTSVECSAHTLKGAACHFLAAPTVLAAQALETVAARDDIAGARSAFPALARAVECLLDRLRAFLRSPVAQEDLQRP
jgi:HPt (histidine-containing phosphotransfer) domain-containing protein